MGSFHSSLDRKYCIPHTDDYIAKKWFCPKNSLWDLEIYTSEFECHVCVQMLTCLSEPQTKKVILVTTIDSGMQVQGRGGDQARDPDDKGPKC